MVKQYTIILHEVHVQFNKLILKYLKISLNISFFEFSSAVIVKSEHCCTCNTVCCLLKPLDEALDKYLQIALNKHYVKTPDGCGGSDTAGSSTGSAVDVLSGCVVCVSRKLPSNQSSGLSALITSLGAVYRTNLDSSVTHLIFQVKYVHVNVCTRAHKPEGAGIEILNCGCMDV